MRWIERTVSKTPTDMTKLEELERPAFKARKCIAIYHCFFFSSVFVFYQSSQLAKAKSKQSWHIFGIRF